MTSFQIYGNTDNFLQMFIYVTAIVFIAQAYLHFDEYNRNINKKVDFLSKIITIQFDKMKEHNKKIEMLESQIDMLLNAHAEHSQFISGASKEMIGYEKKLEMMENQLLVRRQLFTNFDV